MDETEIQTNIEKSARTADIALKIGKVFIVAIILMLIVIFAVTLLIYSAEGPNGFARWVTSENLLSVFGEGITAPVGVDPATAFVAAATVFLVSTIVYLVLFAGMVWSAAKIFSGIRRTRLPFTRENARQLKQVAVWMGLLAVIPPVVEIIGSFLISIPLTTFYLGIELLIAAAIIYCLAHIFEYGALLQKQADETL